MRNGNLKVAFIDDGINPTFVPNGIVFGDFVANKNGVYANANPLNEISHGTMCYQIFQNCVKSPYELISIKILDRETGTGTKDALVAALNWCGSQDIDLINMSMGTRQYSDFKHISQVIAKLPDTIIVAAYSNQNTLTFPACLKSVISVRHCAHEDLRDGFVYIENPFDQVNILAGAQKMPGLFDEDQAEPASGANSFAAPLITARVCDYLAQGHRGVIAIREQLCKASMKNSNFLSYGFYKKMFYDWQETDVPIAAVQGNKSLSLLKPLLMKFINDDYRAVCFTIEEETSAEDFIFKFEQCGNDNVKTSKLLDLYYNFTLPDIIFFHFNEMPKGLQADILLKPQEENMPSEINLDEKYILALNENAGALFEQITKLLS